MSWDRPFGGGVGGPPVVTGFGRLKPKVSRLKRKGKRAKVSRKGKLELPAAGGKFLGFWVSAVRFCYRNPLKNSSEIQRESLIKLIINLQRLRSSEIQRESFKNSSCSYMGNPSCRGVGGGGGGPP